jgi:hypothetical protein
MTGGGNKDPRQVVGGVVYAKADSISRDFKRILGNKFKNAWIRGEVLRVQKKKANPEAKRSTTYVTAKYPCEVHDGVQHYKEKELALQTLKEKDPNEKTNPPAGTAAPEELPPVAAPAAPEEPPTVAETPGTAVLPTEAAAAAGPVPPATAETRASAGSTSTGSTQIPVVTVNDHHWYEGNCNVDMNGKHSSKYWKLQDQYGRGFEFTPGCDSTRDKRFSLLDYFLAVFPKK